MKIGVSQLNSIIRLLSQEDKDYLNEVLTKYYSNYYIEHKDLNTDDWYGTIYLFELAKYGDEVRLNAIFKKYLNKKLEEWFPEELDFGEINEDNLIEKPTKKSKHGVDYTLVF